MQLRAAMAWLLSWPFGDPRKVVIGYRTSINSGRNDSPMRDAVKAATSSEIAASRQSASVVSESAAKVDTENEYSSCIEDSSSSGSFPNNKKTRKQTNTEDLASAAFRSSKLS